LFSKPVPLPQENLQVQKVLWGIAVDEERAARRGEQNLVLFLNKMGSL
jgi:hypothetical protein